MRIQKKKRKGMHIEVKQFIKRVRKEYWHKFRLRKVLEVGSKNINGSPRKYFWFCKYTGIDLSEGSGVDEVIDICDMSFTSNYEEWDVVISTEMLEHCEHWQKALERMFHFLKPNGLLLITCASDDRLEHGTKRTTPECSPDTTDYYRNISKQDFRNVLSQDLFSIYVLMNGRDKQDLYFYGIKK